MIIVIFILLSVAYLLLLLDALTTYLAIRKNNNDFSIERNIIVRKLFEKYGVKKTLVIISFIVFPTIYSCTLLAVLYHKFFIYCIIFFLVIEVLLRISVVYNNITGKQNFIIKLFFKLPFIKDFYGES
ncbi:MAG: hypothetical protein N3A01_00160 [Bacteroidales bacterium]|nr:hypothetical protein [Bacteroidales bacterium]